MNKPSDYTRLINRFSNKLGKLLADDFPEEQEVIEKVHSAMKKLHYAVLGAFLKKGSD